MRKTDESLVQFIKKGLEHCSLENYMGLNLPKGKHTTLGNSAHNDIDRQLRQERKETRELLRSIKKTCQVGVRERLLGL
jgi:hypothetical protein